MPKKSFEKMMSELEETVSSLEDGNLTLDESLKTFEKGVGLAKECNLILENAELKVEKLTEPE